LLLACSRENYYETGLEQYKKGALKSAQLKLNKVKIDNPYYSQSLELLNEIKVKLDSIETENKKKLIAQLEKQVKRIPASEVKRNLDIYNELSALVPSNKRYRRKVDYYQKKYEQIRIQEDRILAKRRAQTENNIDKMAYQLAVINKGSVVDKNDITVIRFKYLVNNIYNKVFESKKQIGDMTVKTQQILREKYGKEIKLLDLMEDLNKCIPDGTKVKYAEIAVAYMQLIK